MPSLHIAALLAQRWYCRKGAADIFHLGFQLIVLDTMRVQANAGVRVANGSGDKITQNMPRPVTPVTETNSEANTITTSGASAIEYEVGHHSNGANTHREYQSFPLSHRVSCDTSCRHHAVDFCNLLLCAVT
jgi:hypothetical protein